MARIVTGLGIRIVSAGLLAGAVVVPASHAKNTKPNNPAQLRTDYIARLQEQDAQTSTHTLGSLWSPEAELSSLSIDYKARKVNDTVVITVSVQTTANQSADVNSSRAFDTSSAITGLAGDINTKGLNPLFNANSSTTLKGSGATDSSSTFRPA
jgi:flagellar L-ring protein precursor FlgH